MLIEIESTLPITSYTPHKINDEIYGKWATHLASLGMGYPDKEELLEILRLNFTPLEAEVALAIPPKDFKELQGMILKERGNSGL